jgi:hypothetical protein
VSSRALVAPGHQRATPTGVRRLVLDFSVPTVPAPVEVLERFAAEVCGQIGGVNGLLRIAGRRVRLLLLLEVVELARHTLQVPMHVATIGTLLFLVTGVLGVGILADGLRRGIVFHASSTPPHGAGLPEA